MSAENPDYWKACVYIQYMIPVHHTSLTHYWTQMTSTRNYCNATVTLGFWQVPSGSQVWYSRDVSAAVHHIPSFCGETSYYIDGGPPCRKCIDLLHIKPQNTSAVQKQAGIACYGMSHIAVPEFVKRVNVTGAEAVSNSSMASMTLSGIITLWKAH